MAPRTYRPLRWSRLLPAVLLLLAALIPALAFAAPEKAPGGIRFTYTDANAAAVFWAGDFNGWNATATPMTKGAGGTWTVIVPLPAGKQMYKFVVDGQWFPDPENPATAGEYGNSVIEVGAGGELVTQKATSNTAYSPKIFMGGRVHGLYQSLFDPTYSRYEMRDPLTDFDLGFDVRVSDVLKVHLLTNISPQKEDVQDYRSRLNFKRGSIEFQDPNLRVFAYDSENLPTWDDPLHLVGDIGVYGHPFGYQRQGFVAQTDKYGLQSEIQYSDNFDVGGTEFPDFSLSRTNPTRNFVFDSDPAGKAIALLQSVREGANFVLPRDQVGKVQSTDVGDNGGAFGYGDGGENVFAARVRKALPGALTLGLLGRSDRGFNLGRIYLARPVGDSLVRSLSGNFSQEWFAAGVDARWSPRPDWKVWGEYLQGARRYSLVTGSWTDWNVSAITATGATAASGLVRAADGEHLTVERSWRAQVGGAWTFAQSDIGLTASVGFENHSYPAWTQAPITPPGLAADDHQRFENVDYQRAGYLNASDEIDNQMVVLEMAWDRNWRHYLNREVKTRLDLQLTDFDYDRRTAWEYQLWFPTGNFWLESGQHVVTLDRLTALGTDQVLRVRPSIDVPFWYGRRGLFGWHGTLSWADSGGVELSRAPRYAESIFRLGLDVTRQLRFTNDSRWVKYDVPELNLGSGYFSQFSELTWSFTPTITLGVGFGVDPDVLDPNTNEFAPIGRERYLADQYVDGYWAQTNYNAPNVIAEGEKRLELEKRFQVQAIVHF